MTRRWYLFVTVFIIGVALTIAGFALASSALVLVGILISVALFFSRRFIQ